MAYHTTRLQTHYRRYLTNLEDERTKLFFQLIIAGAAVNFDKNSLPAKAQAIVRQLNDMPCHFREQQEFIPYTTLWAIFTD